MNLNNNENKVCNYNYICQTNNNNILKMNIYFMIINLL